MSASNDGFPQVFGKYVLVRPMARGGMGELFLAAAGETGGFEKLCVVKKVLQSLEDPAVHRRFLDEAKVVVRLNHQNLVQVFDAGRVDNEHYLAMELVEGKDLRAVWNRCAQLHRRIPVDVAIFVIREVLRGLDYVHDAMGLDLVHRDISPPNILLGYRGDIKLTDFGLAKSAIKREMTSPGVVFGRYSYLSPEQARGLPADRRTDIYACAIVLWELLTGRQLFPSTGRSHQEALSSVRSPKVRPPSELVPGVPAGIDEILLKALAKDRDLRYDSANAFRSALSEVLARDFPSCDADRLSEFMRDIFARESKLEARDYARYSAQDFSDLRSRSEESHAISVSEVIELGQDLPGVKRSTIPLGESDIVELDKPSIGPVKAVNAKSLRESARSWMGRVVAQRYRIDGLIGIGGMGAVFRVTHMALGRPYALKVLHDVYTRDSEIITRFMREARAATQTGHPNIIDVVDIGTTDKNEVYFVMELLEGDNLGHTIQNEGPLAVRRAVHIARQICRALAAAHEVGIIHRDLKSENILLTFRGKEPDFVKVLDFGICKHMNADSSTTSPGLVIGSPDYMAPEQGAGLEATVASDVYSVGCILFEMLAGQLPFKGRNAVDVLMQKGAREADPVTKYRPEVPEALAAVVSRCLQRTASERPPSMRALEYELTRVIDGRATAVAAVLGLGSGAEGDVTPRPGEDPRAAASASMHRAAVAAIVDKTTPLHMGWPSASGAERISSHNAFAATPASMSGSWSEPPTERAMLRAAGVRAGLKALFFVSLGGLLASGVLVAVAPETAAAVAVRLGLAAPAEPQPEPRSDADDGQATKAGASDDDRKNGEAEGAEPAPDLDSEAAEQPTRRDRAPKVAQPAPTTDLPRPAPAARQPTVDELVVLAEAALKQRAWSEPADESLAMALSRIELRQPGNEAIGRLRRAAAEVLIPAGRRALERKRWRVAAAAFRDLVRVWPEHEGGRAGLVEALANQARVLREHRDYEQVLVTAEELVNLAPETFQWAAMRAEMLSRLERWDHARDAWAAAREIDPSNRYAKKSLREAAIEAKRARARQR